MAILRFAPGERVEIAGTYALVGHYGEALGFAVRLDKGEQLPLVAADADYGPVWFVQIAVAGAASQAA